MLGCRNGAMEGPDLAEAIGMSLVFREIAKCARRRVRVPSNRADEKLFRATRHPEHSNKQFDKQSYSPKRTRWCGSGDFGDCAVNAGELRAMLTSLWADTATVVRFRPLTFGRVLPYFGD